MSKNNSYTFFNQEVHVSSSRLLFVQSHFFSFHPSRRLIADRGTRIIYNCFKKASDGCDLNSIGFGGSISPRSVARLFQLVDVYGLRIVDMGGGVGKFTVAAMINGAGSAIGYELPGNIAQKLIFDAATSRIQLPTTRPAQWIPKDIDEVFFLFIKLFTSPFNSFLSLCSQMLKLPDMTEHVYSFWVGMPYSTQVHILYLACSCPTVETIVVYRDHKWRTPESGMVSYSPLLAYLTVFAAVLKQLKSQCSCNDWILQHVLKTTMQGSGEKKTAWIFRAI